MTKGASRDKDYKRNRSSREAAKWFATFLDETTPQAEYVAFRDWLEADPQNAKAYAQLERMWAQAGTEPLLSPPARTRRELLKIGGSFVMLAGAGALGWAVFDRSDYSTRIGELRTFTLADGSVLELSAASAIRVEFNAATRRIVLLQGEVFFRVAVDSVRPFIVEANSLTATALGTAFSASLFSERTSVAVIQHSVRVVAHGRTLVVEEGAAVDLEDNALGEVISGEADRRLAWRFRQLAFFARPLGEIVEVLNRWRKGRLVVLDPVLAARRVTTIIDMSDMDGIDRTLEQGLPISLSNYTPFLTLVSARK